MNSVPDTVDEGGHFLVSESQGDPELLFDSLDEPTRGVVSKLCEKNVLVTVSPPENAAGFRRSQIFDKAKELPQNPKGQAQITTHGEMNTTMRYSGYSEEGIHEGYVLGEDGHTTTKVGKIAKHKLISLQHPYDWDDDPGDVVNW